MYLTTTHTFQPYFFKLQPIHQQGAAAAPAPSGNRILRRMSFSSMDEFSQRNPVSASGGASHRGAEEEEDLEDEESTSSPPSIQSPPIQPLNDLPQNQPNVIIRSTYVSKLFDIETYKAMLWFSLRSIFLLSQRVSFHMTKLH